MYSQIKIKQYTAQTNINYVIITELFASYGGINCNSYFLVFLTEDNHYGYWYLTIYYIYIYIKCCWTSWSSNCLNSRWKSHSPFCPSVTSTEFHPVSCMMLHVGGLTNHKLHVCYKICLDIKSPILGLYISQRSR